jgi:hypothetical protein
MPKLSAMNATTELTAEVSTEASTPQRAPQPTQPDMPGWAIYIACKKAHYAAKEAATLAQRAQQQADRKCLAAQQKAQRKDLLLAGQWDGKGEQLNALATEQAAEKAALKDQQQHERKALSQAYTSYPNLAQWQRAQRQPELAEQWLHRASALQRIEGEASEKSAQSTLRNIRGYVGEIVGKQVHYRCKEEAARDGAVCFVDKGRDVDIYEWRSADNTLAALQLAAQKWGRFHVEGTDEYKALCAKLTAEHGFTVTNPELQERIKEARQRTQQQRREELARAEKSVALKEFERYAKALGAQRYRVTLTQRQGDGSTETFLMGTERGTGRTGDRIHGLTPQEIVRRMPEIQRRQHRGENLYYTPLSDTKHYLLIDGMNTEKLERLMRDGYTPAVVLEIAPGKYQALITVQKLGTEHDTMVGRRLTERLNEDYGNPKLAGRIHPHHAPGYENRSETAQGADGHFPEVCLLQAERRECPKALALSSKIDAQCARLAGQMLQQAEHHAKLAAAIDAIPGSAIYAYWRHYEDVVKCQGGGEIDRFRVGAMIAVRMRVTGHNRDEIKNTLRQCATAMRLEDERGHDWKDDAHRTVRYAYSAVGDRQAAELEKYRSQWERLEGRERLPETVRKIEREGLEPSISPTRTAPGSARSTRTST